MIAAVGPPLHLGNTAPSRSLFGVLSIAGIASALLLSLAVAAFVQRRSSLYLLIVLALGALVARSAAAGFTVIGLLPPDQHHVFEHRLDVVMASLVIGAIYYARTVSKDPDQETTP